MGGLRLPKYHWLLIFFHFIAKRQKSGVLRRLQIALSVRVLVLLLLFALVMTNSARYNVVEWISQDSSRIDLFWSLGTVIGVNRSLIDVHQIENGVSCDLKDMVETIGILTNLAEQSVFHIQFWCRTQGNEELTGVVAIWTSCHCNQTTSIKLQTLMGLDLELDSIITMFQS